MLKLLIVEDEKWERDGLLDFFDWKDFSIDVVETACDGIEGLEKAEAFLPDIIITDIRMPGMDGIRMSKKIKEFLPNVKVIILTGYDDFKFAKEAISFQANAYLLKPLEEEEFIPVVQRVTKECLIERKNKESERSMKELFEQSQNFAVIKFFTDLLNGNIESLKVKQQTELLNIQAPLDGNYNVIVIKLNHDPGDIAACPDESRIMDEAEIEKIFKKIMPSLNSICLFHLADTAKGQLVIPIFWSEEAKDIIETKVPEAIHNVRELNSLPLVVGVGSPVAALKDISICSAQAFEAVNFATFWSLSGTMYFEAVNSIQSGFAEKTGEFLMESSYFVKQLIHAVKSSNNERLVELQKNLFDFIKENNGVGRDLLVNFIQGIINEVTIFLYTLDKDFDKPDTESTSIRTNLSEQHTLAACEKHLSLFFENAINKINGIKYNKDDQIIKKVIKLIDERYMSEISLKTISGEVFLSPNYLGSIFKKSMGKSFNDYLCEYRMEKARELLKSPKNKVNWVAQEVGIPNTSYFCTIFKNTYGMAPGEFQELILRNQ